MGQIVVWCVAGLVGLLATVSLFRFDVSVWVTAAKNLWQPKVEQTASPVPDASPKLRPQDAKVAEAGKPKLDVDKPKFDVVRIDPDGPSVFAGRAAANTTVTVMANDVPIANPKADGSGDWAVVVERKFAAGDYQFSLSSKPGQAADGQSVRMSIAASERVAAKPAPATAPKPFPRPITFVYDEATFTPDGQLAAAALSEYLQSRPVDTVTLSGHADERGSQPYNMELSRQRLQVVEQYLRGRGFSGKLVLLPKGKLEPFAISERDAMPKDLAYQLDRRVELRQP
jgi:outer membrane protein OmpA-like peptidoglycan-associated protein